MSDDDSIEISTETLAESEHYVAWESQEPDGETVYHIELGPVTLNFFQEEWDEFVALIKEANKQ